MQKLFTSRRGRLLAAVLIIITAFIIHSCHKDMKLTPQETAAQAFPVSVAKDWFAGNKSSLATRLKLNSDVSFLNDLSNFTPVWDSARTALDTSYYVVEVPANYAKKYAFVTDSNKANVNGLTRLLVLKNKQYGTISAVLMHVHGTGGAYIQNVHYMAVPPAFSGNIFYTDLQGVFYNGYIFKNGKVVLKSTGTANTAKPAGPQILQAEPGPDGCQNIYTDWYQQTCYYTANDELIQCTDWAYVYTTVDSYCPPTSGGGGSAPVVQPDCPDGYVPAGDGGGGGGGGIDLTSVHGKLIVNTAYGTTARCVPDTAKQKKKTPCDSAALISAMKATVKIKAQDSSIEAQTQQWGKEYGANRRFNTLKLSDYQDTPITGPQKTTTGGGDAAWTTDFKWNSIDGYQTGFDHGHPDNTGPAPRDVFQLLYPLYTNADLRNAPATDQAFYKANAEVTTTTIFGNYVVMVSDFDKLKTIADNFDSTQSETDTFTFQYTNIGATYLYNNSNATVADAGAYALMKLFGDCISVYFAPANNSNYQPIKIAITDNGPTLKVSPCPPAN